MTIRRTSAARVLTAAVHELAQPCASAMLVADTARILATRHGAPDLASCLESVVSELGRLQARLRLFGRLAVAETSHAQPTDIAEVAAAVLPGVAALPRALACVHHEIAAVALVETARAISAAAERTEIRHSRNAKAVEVHLRGARSREQVLENLRLLMSLTRISLTIRKRNGEVRAIISLPAPHAGSEIQKPRAWVVSRRCEQRRKTA